MQCKKYSPSLYIYCLLLLLLATALVSCAPQVRNFEVQVPENTTTFFSLSTGRTVAGPHLDWDLAFGASGTIYTNSGTSAETFGTQGQGGAWALGKQDIQALSSESIGEEDFQRARTADTKLWVQVYYLDEPWAPATEMTLNSFMYLGYRGGAGTQDEPLRDHMDYASSNYYSYSMGGHGTRLTGQVYLVRHADGERYSLVQITGRESGYPNRIFRLSSKRI